MNKNILAYVLCFTLFICIIIFYIWSIFKNNKCTEDSDCSTGERCDNGKCKKMISVGCEKDSDCSSGERCDNGKCKKMISIGCEKDSDCSSGERCDNGKCKKIISVGCNPPCSKDKYCDGTECVFPSIESQEDSSIQIINNTSETYLHVFLQVDVIKWVKLSGTGILYEPINWGENNNTAWDPVGAMNLSEVIIPKNGNIILNIPSDMNRKPFRVTPLKFKVSDDLKPVNSYDSAISKIYKQWPILIEGGKEVVADSSAVDGINFKMKYELTTKDGIKVMEIKKNPCEGLGKKYTSDVVDVGCRNPAKVDCEGKASCDCKGNQNCKFNNCSDILFDIPGSIDEYKYNYDGGNPTPVVKKFINDSSNLKKSSPLKNFCDKLQNDSGDFTAYCYDYNDVSSSPWLSSPYKMKLTYTDL
jgi:Cys-rich repeat protein